MKLVIKEGTDLETAIEQLSGFLREFYLEYPIIKNDVSLDLTLENLSGLACPDNEKEYIISGSDQAKELLEKAKQRALEKLHDQWKEYVLEFRSHLKFLQNQIKNDAVYLETAEARGRTKANIAIRTEKAAKNRSDYEKDHRRYYLIQELDSFINQGLFKIYFAKDTRKAAYQYSLSAFFVFICCNGYTGYFDGKELIDENYETKFLPKKPLRKV